MACIFSRGRRPHVKIQAIFRPLSELASLATSRGLKMACIFSKINPKNPKIIPENPKIKNYSRKSKN